MKSFSIVIFSLMVSSITMMPKTKCKIEKRVKVALRALNRDIVSEVVNCLVDKGDCDAIGNEVKGQTREAICSKPCSQNNSCSCEQIQIRLIMRKIKKEYNDQFQRVKDFYGKLC